MSEQGKKQISENFTYKELKQNAVALHKSDTKEICRKIDQHMPDILTNSGGASFYLIVPGCYTAYTSILKEHVKSKYETPDLKEFNVIKCYTTSGETKSLIYWTV